MLKLDDSQPSSVSYVVQYTPPNLRFRISLTFTCGLKVSNRSWMRIAKLHRTPHIILKWALLFSSELKFSDRQSAFVNKDERICTNLQRIVFEFKVTDPRKVELYSNL